MEKLKKFKNFINEITKSNSRNYKIEILEKYKTDEDIKSYLNFIFNPFIVTGISDSKINKHIAEIRNDEAFPEMPLSTTVMEYVKEHNTGRDCDIYIVQEYMNYLPEDLKELFKKIITKDISIGVEAKTINKVIPNLIPTFSVQLANKYFDDMNRVNDKEFALTRKIDGCRIIALKDEEGVKFFTRQGQPYEGLVDLAQELEESGLYNVCFDGEITLLDPGDLVSKDQYKATTKIVRADGEKHGVKMLVFDMMDASEFKDQKCVIPYHKRRDRIDDCFSHHTFKYFENLPVLYKGKDSDEILNLLNDLTEKGEEGVMINILDAPYEFKRTWNLMKVKKFNSCDLRVIGFEEGTGKNAGRLGAILCAYKDGNIVKCGSGFDDAMRIEVWNNKSKYANKIVEIGYFEETCNANGGVSLRFPTFKDWRFDKDMPNF